MAKVFSKADLPHFRSTRDGRDRLDLVTENVPLGAERLKADRILYHPGDTCAKHYHVTGHHLFVMLEGEGQMFADGKEYHLKAGSVAAVPEGEMHWFENNSGANFKFIEFWAPLPNETVWIQDDDI